MVGVTMGDCVAETAVATVDANIMGADDEVIDDEIVVDDDDNADDVIDDDDEDVIDEGDEDDTVDVVGASFFVASVSVLVRADIFGI